MPTFEQIRGEEERKAFDIRKRIYRNYETLRSLGMDVDPAPDPAWRKVWVGEYMISTTNAEIYARNRGGWPRRDGLPEIESRLDPLLWCLRARGGASLIVTNDTRAGTTGRQGLNPLYYRCAIDRDSVGGAIVDIIRKCEHIKGPPYMDNDTYFIAFDDTAEWVLADDGHLDCWQQLLMGTPEFMKQYFAAAGGEDYVRAWFYHYDIYQYNCDERDECVRSGFTKRNPYCDFIDQKYAYVGWPTPWEIYPSDGPWDGHDIDWSPIFGDRIKSSGPGLPHAD